jgi:hypothetical protein
MSVREAPQFPWQPLGQLLVEMGLLGQSSVDEALAEQRTSGARLGEILVAKGLITGADLTCVLAEQYGLRLEVERRAEQLRPRPVKATPAPPAPWRPLGRVLLDKGLLSQTKLTRALTEQRRSGRLLGRILVDGEVISWYSLAAALAEQHGVESGDDETLRLVVSPAPERPVSETVYEVSGDSAEAGVLFRSGSFLEATDFAFDYLEEHNPISLEIVRVRGDAQETVWTYSEQLAAEAASRKSVDTFGFDVSNWSGPPQFSPHRPRRAN